MARIGYLLFSVVVVLSSAASFLRTSNAANGTD